MNPILEKLIEDCLTDKKSLISFKNSAAKSGKLELAAYLRSIEKDMFPEQKEAVEAQEKAHEIDVLFRLVNLNVNPKTIWVILQAITIYLEKEGKTDIHDASVILSKANLFFD